MHVSSWSEEATAEVGQVQYAAGVAAAVHESGSSAASRSASVSTVSDGAFGPGSANPADDGSGPAGYDIKGNADSMLYHTADSPYLGRTKAEVWFDSESSADAAGFTRWDRRDQNAGGSSDEGAIGADDRPYSERTLREFLRPWGA